MSDNRARPHRWHIESREYERHESRRGRRHAFENLAASSTALVVVDMVPFFVAESTTAHDIVDTINALARALRTAGGIVSWIVPEPDEHTDLATEFYGSAVAARYAASGGQGPLVQRLWPDLDHRPDDIVLAKTASSAFFPGRCDLHQHLGERGVDTVLIAGTVANVCCESTARDARTLGYRVVMVADGVTAATDDMVNATLRTVYRSFGDVRPAAEIINILA